MEIIWISSNRYNVESFMSHTCWYRWHYLRSTMVQLEFGSLYTGCMQPTYTMVPTKNWTNIRDGTRQWSAMNRPLVWIESSDFKLKRILDSSSSSHVFNDKRFFDQLELCDLDVVVFHLRYNAKSTLQRCCDSIVTCKRHSLQEEECYYIHWTV